MITLKEWMEVVGYRITEGSVYNQFGSDAYCLDSWSGSQDGYSLSIVFDTKTQVVYKVEAHDYQNRRSYRQVNVFYQDQVTDSVAYDDVEFVNLDLHDDWIEKAIAIVAGEDYDTRVQMQVEFSDDELLTYMKMAHEQDVTFNQFVVNALQQAIDQHKQTEAFA
jgi:hypothetical protein